ncbi:unnamed protein product, partial [Prorocentrum cordatum]
VDLVANETTTTVAELVRNDFLQVLKGFPSDQLWYQSVLEENLAPEHMLAGTSIAPCPIFKGIAKETLSAVEPCVLRRLYFPGEHLFDEGAPSEALYMLIRGRASVEKAGRVVRYETRKHVSEGGRRRRSMQQLQTGSVLLRPPPQPMQLGDRAQRAKETENEPVVCFGEVEVLGAQQSYSYTAVAQSVCHVRLVHRRVLLQLLAQHADLRKEVRSMGRSLKRSGTMNLGSEQERVVLLTSLLREAELLRSAQCSDAFLQYLAQNLESKVFIAGHAIFQEDTVDDRSMYIIGSGHVRVLRKGSEAWKMGPGAVIGEAQALGLVLRRSVTVIAAETCLVQVLHQSVLVRALEMFPDQRAKVLAMISDQCRAGLLRRPDAPAAEGAPPMGPVKTGASVASLPGGPMGNVKTGSNPAISAMQEMMERSSFLREFPRSFLLDLAASATDRIFLPGEIIIEEGSRSSSMFVITSGTAACFVRSRGVPLALHEEEDRMQQTSHLEIIANSPRPSLGCPRPSVKRPSLRAPSRGASVGSKRRSG